MKWDEDHIPEPDIIMFGCRAITALAPTPGRCPSCGRGIHDGDDSRYCGLCDALSPRREAQVQRVKHTLLARDRAERAERRLKSHLDTMAKVTLSEGDRRRLWNGYRGGILAEMPEGNSNTVKITRDWLISINQAPDWSIVLIPYKRRARPEGETDGRETHGFRREHPAR